MKTQLISLLRTLPPRLAVLAVIGFAAMNILAGSPFSRIVVLGDSLSDTGNFYVLSGGSPASPPYAAGRFSNGPLWVEYLAEDLGMQIAAGDNYAVGGATTGTLNSNNAPGETYPGLQQQLASLLAAHPNGLDPDALYTLWIGANDFFVALAGPPTPQAIAAMIGAGVGNTAAAIQTLWAAGARHIMVVNIPDLGLTPFALGSGMAPVITGISATYNQYLAGALAQLEQAGIALIEVDSFATLQAMVNDPAQYGFANVIAPALYVPGSDPDQFLFWDPVHPTTVGHEVLAAAAAQAAIRHYSPAKGKGSPAARINSLNGLLQAGHPR